MQFTTATPYSIVEGQIVRFKVNGTTYLGRVQSATLSLRAEVKDVAGYRPVLVDKRADAYENVEKVWVDGVTDVEHVVFEAGDVVTFDYAGQTYTAPLYGQGVGVDHPLGRSALLAKLADPIVCHPRTHAVAPGISNVWPVGGSNGSPAEQFPDSTTTSDTAVDEEKERLTQRIADLERLNAQQTRTINLMTETEMRVGEKAMELAREHGWCGVVTDALDELCIPVPTREQEIRLTVDLVFTATCTDRMREVDTSWAQESFGGTDRSGERTISLDSDWEDAAVKGEARRVASVEEVGARTSTGARRRS